MGNIKVLNNIILDPATANRALKTDGSKIIGAGTPTDTELGYLSGVTSAIQTQFTNKTNPMVRILQALGSTIKAETVEMRYVLGNTGAFTSQRFWLVPIWLEADATLTGVKFYQSTGGVYTASNVQRIGLYTYSGGTCTLVASCANDANLFKGTSNTWTTKAFSSTYAAAAGLFFIGYIASWSASTTIPQIGASASFASNTLSAPDLTNSAKLVSTVNSLTDLPSTQAMSGTTVQSVYPYFALY